MGTVAIHFQHDETWIEDSDGHQWLYTPGVFGSALWAEYGVIYEQDEINLLARVLPPEGVMVDVGANIGLHSIKLAARVKGLSVYAFEPVGTTITGLRRNVVRNSVDRQIYSCRVAISDHDGETRLTTSSAPGNFIIPRRSWAHSATSERVPSRRLDSLLPELGAQHVDLVKCDVEGHELAVLRGASALLTHQRPTIFVEIIDRYVRRYGHTGTDVFDFLFTHGYAYRIVMGNRLELPSSPSVDLRRTANFLFVHPDNPSALRRVAFGD